MAQPPHPLDAIFAQNQFSRTADLGLRAVTQPRVRAARARARIGQAQGQETGTNLYDQLSETFDQMDRIQAAAAQLDERVRTYVGNASFQGDWDNWYRTSWYPFYSKYRGPDASLGTLTATPFLSEELSRQTESYRMQLETWLGQYGRQTQPNGQPVPRAGIDIPETAHETGKPTSVFPWWAWTLIGVGAAGIAYAAYRYVTSGGGALGAARAFAGSDRDPRPSRGLPPARRSARDDGDDGGSDGDSGEEYNGLPTLDMFARERALTQDVESLGIEDGY